MKRILRLLLLIAVLPAQGGAANAGDDAFKLFEEEARVVTASRRPQAVSEVPWAVDVVTSEEIRASGASNIWDLLRFRAGMDVLDGRSLDGNRAVVSARGIPHEFASNLLVLVDGRSVSSLNQGGVYWAQLPVQLQDIERVEIVRGPNAALYGTGAGVGVVNILTRKPSGKAAFETDTRGGNRGSVLAFQAVEAPLLAKLAMRISHTFQQEEGFPRAPGSRADDSLRKNALNVRAGGALSERANLELFGGGSWSSPGLATEAAGLRGSFENGFGMLRLTYRPSEDSSVEATGSRSDFRSDAPQWSLARDSRQIQHDADVLHRFSWGDSRLNTTYGTSYRNVLLASPDLYGSSHPRLELYRGYLQQGVGLTERLSVQGALSLEGSNAAGVHPNYQTAAVLAPVPEHAFRASYAVAHTLRDFIPVYGDLRPDAITRVLGNAAVSRPYKITSYEAGYNGSWLEHRLQADASLFYTKIDAFHQIFFDSFAFPVTTLKFQLYDDAIARGAELRLKYRFAAGRWVYANYTYERVSDHAGDRGQITANTPSHKINVGGSAELAGGVKVGADLGYKDAYLIQAVGGGSTAVVPRYWRLDARLAYVLPWYRGAECYVAGQNLFQPSHTEFGNAVQVARTYAGGVSIRFGGNERHE